MVSVELPLEIDCGPREGGNKRVVYATRGSKEHRDTLDTDSAFSRSKFVDEVLGRMFNGSKSIELSERIERQLLDAADARDDGAADDGPAELDACPVREFMKRDYRQEMLINGILPAAQPGVAAAKSKSLKTTTVAEVLVSAASGVPFLGQEQWSVAKPVPAGFISAESGGATLQESLRRIAVAKGLHIEDVDLHVGTSIPHLATQKGRDLIERFIDRHRLGVLGLDPTYKAFAGVDTHIESKMAELLFPLSEIIDRTGCTILLVSHNRKTPAIQGRFYDEPSFDDIAGTGFQQWARFFLLLNKRREWDPDTGRHWLWFKAEGSAGFGCRKYLDVREGRREDVGGRVWEVTVSDPSEGREREQEAAQAEKDAQQLIADRKAVCAALARHPAGLTKTKMMDLSGVSRRRAESLLEVMLDEGDIQPTEVVIANQKTPRPGYKLADQDTDQEAA